MKVAIVFVAVCLAIASAIPVNEPQIRSQSTDIQPDGSFRWGYELDNGETAEQVGTLKNVGTEQEAAEVRGSVKWTDDVGQVHTLEYVANENGYQPISSDIPVGN